MGMERHGHRLLAVGSLGYHLQIGLALNDHAEPGPDELLVIGNRDSDRHLS